MFFICWLLCCWLRCLRCCSIYINILILIYNILNKIKTYYTNKKIIDELEDEFLEEIVVKKPEKVKKNLKYNPKK